jgi:hypothetical protein
LFDDNFSRLLVCAQNGIKLKSVKVDCRPIKIAYNFYLKKINSFVDKSLTYANLYQTKQRTYPRNFSIIKGMLKGISPKLKSHKFLNPTKRKYESSQRAIS